MWLVAMEEARSTGVKQLLSSTRLEGPRSTSDISQQQGHHRAGGDVSAGPIKMPATPMVDWLGSSLLLA